MPHAQRWLANQGKNIEVIRGYGFPVFLFEKRPVIEGFASGGVSLGGRVQFNMGESRDPTLGQSANEFDVKSASAKLKGEVSLLIIDIEGSETIL